MKKALIFAVLTALAFGGFWLWRDVGLKSETRENIKIKNELESARSEALKKETSRLVGELMAGVGEKNEWISAIKSVKNLPEKDRDKLTLLAKGKLFEAMFWESEDLLFKARLMLAEDQNSPSGQRYMAEVAVTYRELDGIIQELKDVGDDPEWNGRMNYLLGLYRFRSILFAKNEDIADIVAKSAGHFAKVFAYKPKDRDAEVALEILQKRFSSEGESLSAKDKLELLPQTDPAFVITGRSRGRH